MFQFKATSCLALAVLLASVNALAQETATLTITGAITPAACGITFEKNGVIDLGNTSIAKLDDQKLTKLGKKAIKFHISCDAEAKIALNATPRADVLKISDIPGSQTVAVLPGELVVPFDRVDNKTLGYYNIVLSSASLVDSDNANTIYSDDSIPTGEWSVALTDLGRSLYPGVNRARFFSFLKSGTVKKIPTAARQFLGVVEVEAYLPRKGDAVGGRLNSTATLSITYL